MYFMTCEQAAPSTPALAGSGEKGPTVTTVLGLLKRSAPAPLPWQALLRLTG